MRLQSMMAQWDRQMLCTLIHLHNSELCNKIKINVKVHAWATSLYSLCDIWGTNAQVEVASQLQKGIHQGLEECGWYGTDSRAPQSGACECNWGSHMCNVSYGCLWAGVYNNHWLFSQSDHWTVWSILVWFCHWSSPWSSTWAYVMSEFIFQSLWWSLMMHLKDYLISTSSEIPGL